MHRVRSGVEQAIEHRHAGGDIVEVLQHGDEFVAAKPRERVAFAQRLLHARGDGDQQLVAGLVAVLVIDRLETVEVEIGHGQHVVAALRLRHRLPHTVGEQHAIGQIGQRVIVRNALQLLLKFLCPGNVGE